MPSARHWNFALKIRGLDLKSVPMARLGEYMREFAELLGERTKVRFAGAVAGSAVLRARVEPQAVTDTMRSILAARTGDAANETIYHVTKIEKLLREDTARAEIIRPDGNVLYVFEGAKQTPSV